MLLLNNINVITLIVQENKRNIFYSYFKRVRNAFHLLFSLIFKLEMSGAEFNRYYPCSLTNKIRCFT
jgi:hypothetical protein